MGKKIENTILMVIMVSIIGLASFFGFIGTSSSANDTNNTNSTNTTNVANVATASSSAVTAAAAADPTANGTGEYPSVSINVNNSVNFGTVVADGSEYPYTSATQVNVAASEYNSYLPPSWGGPSYADDTLNLYIKATGNLVSSSDSIPINNLKYNGFSNSSLPKTSFTTSYSQIRSWQIPYSSWSWGYFMSYYSLSTSVNGNYYLTVPTGVAGETYTTTVYYLAILQ